MAYPAYIREKAIDMRRRGSTLDEITERLALPRTTVFYWIKDIPIPPRPRRPPTPGQRKAARKMVATYWIRRLTRNKVTYRVQYHADQDVAGLQWFWGTHLGVEPDEIGLQRKSNSNQLNGRTWRSAHGVLTVSTYDTYFRSRMQAWIDCVKERWLDSISLGA